ncbi:hypothetical protein ACEQUB_00932 [Ralstonia syzygii]|uniref:Transmembrane protein n=2 Tax=Ralstonia syzygii TaxID=28097 RepID=G3A640_9RALS|nr:membrane hypothetical protein [Ralstonia syzygii R24]
MVEKSHEEYLACFRGPEQFGDGVGAPAVCDKFGSDPRLTKAYEVALDIRKFEIDLYWKRSNSFWLIVAALGALLIGTLSAKDLGPNLKSLVVFSICVFAAVVAYAWSLVNKAGKFWQRNWEYQVDLLEDAVIGPLYKTVFSKHSPKAEQLYSVSKLNLALSHCVILAFLTCAVLSFCMPCPTDADAVKDIWGKVFFSFVAALAAWYVRREGKADTAKSGVSELRLHYTRRTIAPFATDEDR